MIHYSDEVGFEIVGTTKGYSERQADEEWLLEPLQYRYVNEEERRHSNEGEDNKAQEDRFPIELLGCLRCRVAPETDRQVPGKQHSEKRKGEDELDAIFDQEDGDEEGRGHGVEESRQQQLLLGVFAE